MSFPKLRDIFTGTDSGFSPVLDKTALALLNPIIPDIQNCIQSCVEDSMFVADATPHVSFKESLHSICDAINSKNFGFLYDHIFPVDLYRTIKSIDKSTRQQNWLHTSYLIGVVNYSQVKG